MYILWYLFERLDGRSESRWGQFEWLNGLFESELARFRDRDRLHDPIRVQKRRQMAPSHIGQTGAEFIGMNDGSRRSGDERRASGHVEFKPRDLRDDCGYKVDVGSDLGWVGSKPAPFQKQKRVRHPTAFRWEDLAGMGRCVLRPYIELQGLLLRISLVIGGPRWWVCRGSGSRTGGVGCLAIRSALLWLCRWEEWSW